MGGELAAGLVLDLAGQLRATTAPRYLEPGRFDRWFNNVVIALARLGVSVWGSRLLYVRGRTSGQWRVTPVNLLTYHGDRYLVAPRG